MPEINIASIHKLDRLNTIFKGMAEGMQLQSASHAAKSGLTVTALMSINKTIQ